MSFQQRFLYGMASGMGSIIIKTLLNIMLIPFFITFLGVESYSLFVLLIGLLEISSLFDFGFGAALVKVLGSSNKTDRHQQFLKVGHLVYLGFSLVLILTGWILHPMFSPVFHIPASMHEIARISLLIIMFEAALTLYSGYFRSVLMAHCLHQWSNLSDTVFILAANFTGILLLINGFGVILLLVARLVAALIRSGILLHQTLKVEPFALMPKSSFHYKSFKELGQLSMHAFMVNLSITVSHKIDTFIIALFLPLKMVAGYEIVFRFLGISLQIATKISEGVFPMFARLVSLSKKEESRHLFLRMSCFNNYIVSVLMLLIFSFYPQLFYLFSADKIPFQSTLPILFVAIPCIWSGVLQMPASHYLFVSGKQKFLSFSSLITALSNLILSVILVQHFGIVGVALGTLIPQFIQHQAFLIVATCRDLGISYGEYISSVHLSILFPIFIVWLWIQLIKPILHVFQFSFITLGVVAALTLILGGILWIAFLSTSSEKTLLFNKIIFPLKQRLIMATGETHG